MASSAGCSRETQVVGGGQRVSQSAAAAARGRTGAVGHNAGGPSGHGRAWRQCHGSSTSHQQQPQQSHAIWASGQALHPASSLPALCAMPPHGTPTVPPTLAHRAAAQHPPTQPPACPPAQLPTWVEGPRLRPDLGHLAKVGTGVLGLAAGDARVVQPGHKLDGGLAGAGVHLRHLGAAAGDRGRAGQREGWVGGYVCGGRMSGQGSGSTPAGERSNTHKGPGPGRGWAGQNLRGVEGWRGGQSCEEGSVGCERGPHLQWHLGCDGCTAWCTRQGWITEHGRSRRQLLLARKPHLGQVALVHAVAHPHPGARLCSSRQRQHHGSQLVSIIISSSSGNSSSSSSSSSSSGRGRPPGTVRQLNDTSPPPQSL